MSENIGLLLNQMANDNQEAYRTLFCKYYPRVHAFVLGMLKNRDDADDLAQMVFMKIWIKRAAFADVENFDAYLYRISKNAVLNFIASRNMYLTDLGEPSAAMVTSSATDNPEAQLEARDAQLMIEMVVDSMPPQRQQVYRLSRENMLSNDEIAARLQIAKKTVENHMNLALKEIRKALLMLCVIFLLP